MARQRKPVEKHKLEGTYQPCRHSTRNPPKPAPVKRAPSPPAWLSKEVKKIFRKKAKEMMEVNILTKLDVETLATFCLLYHKVSTEPESVNSAMVGQMRSFANDLGLTPSSRERLNVKPDSGEEEEFNL